MERLGPLGLTFNGSNQDVAINYASLLDLGTAFTLAAWVNVTEDRVDNGLIGALATGIVGYSMALTGTFTIIRDTVKHSHDVSWL